MAQVSLAADEAVYALLDRDSVMEKFYRFDVNFIFSCVKTDDWADDSWMDTDGTPFHIIKLPYELVISMNKEQVRELMLAKALERLQQAA